jgi:hypothetical protein
MFAVYHQPLHKPSHNNRIGKRSYFLIAHLFVERLPGMGSN